MLQGIAHQIWDSKYRLKDTRGEPVDHTIEDTFKRVAHALAQGEPNVGAASYWETRFYEGLANWSVLPAGRIWAGAGSKRKVTLLNCYVSPPIPDSLRGIHEVLGYGALTMKEGGGLGTDFSTLRPKNAIIEDLGVTASGPLSFMDNWDSMCRTIMSAGHRRGAMMGTLRCGHPDIEEFIEAKRDKTRWRNFNVSVLVTDAFMKAVREDAPWPLVFDGVVYKTINARDLWDKIMRSTYDYADPGVLFIDRINAGNPLGYAEELICTNPCAEQPLPPWGACCLGSINLVQHVSDPFTEGASINLHKVAQSAMLMTRMLDNVIEVTHYPLPQQYDEMMRKRRIGVGITGFGDALVMVGVKYSSEEAVRLADSITAAMAEGVAEASIRLGEERGSFPLYDAERYETQFQRGAKYRRNSHGTSIAPTGTISLLAGNISSGIEPIFDLTLKRRILQPDNSWQEVTIQDYAYAEWDKYTKQPTGMPNAAVADAWETVADLKPEHHLAILAAAQRNVDTSISKTINCPADITFEAFKDIYLNAYEAGVKCCSTYRPNDTTGSILSSESMATKEAVPAMSNVVNLTEPLQRPEHLHGTTYRFKPPGQEHALFVTINDVEQHGRRQPHEIFINTKNLQFQSWVTALTLMISAIFRRGGDLALVSRELRAIHDPMGGGYWEDKEYVPSLVAGIGKVIDKHLASLGVAPAAPKVGKPCPSCTKPMESTGGCWSCTSCSYSACG